MLPVHNIRFGIWAALTIAAALSLPRSAVAAQPGGALPDAGDVVRAYFQVRQWVNDVEMPSPDEAAARVEIANASGVCVLLRRDGRVVGSAGVPAGSGNPAMAVRRAAGSAMGQVLGDRAVSALPDELRDDVGNALTLELEVAGMPEPLLGRSYRQIVQQLEPGVHGVAMRRGDRWAMLFPSQQRAANIAGNIESRLPGLARELGLPVADLDALVRSHGASVYRFRTVHLAQQQPGASPFETLRGDVIVRDSAVTTRAIIEMTDALAAHIVERFLPDRQDDEDGSIPSGTVAGDYMPVADTYRPLIAPPLEHALVSYALLRYASTPGVDAAAAETAKQRSREVIENFAQQGDVAEEPVLAAAMVLAVTTLDESRRTDAVSQRLESAGRAVAEALNEAGERDLFADALLVHAAARLLVEDKDLLAADAVRDAIDRLWQAVPEHQQVALLPWIGWAELDYARATGDPVANANRLRQLRELIEQSRVLDDAQLPADLHGGFALAAPGSAVARPTAQSTRPAAFFATMLRIDELTAEDEAPLELGRHLHTLRFLKQLMVREDLLWSMRNADRARGGIRAAPWDSDQPIAAQVMGLLVLVETLQSIDAID